MNSNWSYSPETPNDLGKQYGTSSMLLQVLCSISYPFVNSNLSYSPKTPNLGQNRRFFLAVWPRNFTDDPQKQQGTSFMLLQALCIISYQCQITMPTKPCIGPAASLYRERFDLPRHHGMSVLTFSGSRGSEGTLVKQQSSHFDPLWYTTQGMLLIYPGCWYLVLLEPL